MVRTVDKTTGEIVSPVPPGLWTYYPIPAYKVLGHADEHTAQRVLCTLVSHLGDKGWMVYPSYNQISSLSGVSRSSIRPALDVLEEYEFIKTQKYRNNGLREVNKYYIQMSCFDTKQMSKRARYYIDKPARCLGCAQKISHGDYKSGTKGPIHLRCGGSVLTNKRKPIKTAKETD
jgi:hypothetical protein